MSENQNQEVRTNGSTGVAGEPESREADPQLVAHGLQLTVVVA